MENVQQLADAVVSRLFVELEASGRHVHVTAQQAKVLFGTIGNVLFLCC